VGGGPGTLDGAEVLSLGMVMGLVSVSGNLWGLEGWGEEGRREGKGREDVLE